MHPEATLRVAPASTTVLHRRGFGAPKWRSDPGQVCSPNRTREPWSGFGAVYSNNVGAEYHSNMGATVVEGTSVPPALCVVAVERTAWGAVKRFYE